MHRLVPTDEWPESWRTSFHYDLMELFGERPRTGYAQAYRTRRAHTLRLIQSISQPGSTVLDVAAAQGNFSIPLAALGYRVTWNDLRAELEGYVRAKAPEADITFCHGNALELSGRFDVVLAAEVIEHVAHPDQFLLALRRLVRPGGHIVLTTPNGLYFRNRLPRFSDSSPAAFESVQFRPDADGHIFLLHPDELHRLATDCGMRVMSLEFFCNSLTAGHVKLNHVLPLIPWCLVGALERITPQWPLAKKFHCGMAAVLHLP